MAYTKRRRRVTMRRYMATFTKGRKRIRKGFKSMTSRKRACAGMRAFGWRCRMS